MNKDKFLWSAVLFDVRAHTIHSTIRLESVDSMFGLYGIWRLGFIMDSQLRGSMLPALRFRFACLAQPSMGTSWKL